MEFFDADFLSSPVSIIVSLLIVAFLANEAWPRISRQKKIEISKRSESPVKKSSGSGLSVIKEPEVPEGWWNGRDAFELERRALFSKTWLYLAHSTQLIKPGAYQSFDVAGFPIFVIRGKDNQIRAFHNVCRHRAYTITRKETGASTVLGCRYHGWSYDTTGRLVKAPQFDDVPGFNKSENSLFEIHTRTTDHGHVFVNLNAEEPTSFDSSTLAILDEFSVAARLGASEWVTGQTLTTNFNWKLGPSDTHYADLVAQLEEQISVIDRSSLMTKITKLAMRTNNQADCSLFPGNFFYSFKDAGLWLSLSFFPATETSTHVRYDLFDCAPKMTTDENELAKAIEKPVQNLVRNLESEFRSVDGGLTELSPNSRELLDCVQRHEKLERAQGSPIMPAMHKPKGSSLFQQAEQLCKELDCSGPGSHGDGNGVTSGGLDW